MITKENEYDNKGYYYKKKQIIRYQEWKSKENVDETIWSEIIMIELWWKIILHPILELDENVPMKSTLFKEK